jgi:hypothetical protein
VRQKQKGLNRIRDSKQWSNLQLTARVTRHFIQLRERFARFTFNDLSWNGASLSRFRWVSKTVEHQFGQMFPNLFGENPNRGKERIETASEAENDSIFK